MYVIFVSFVHNAFTYDGGGLPYSYFLSEKRQSKR